MRTLVSLLVGALVAVTLVARPARACGGFFCARAPIDQSGENIAFAVDPGHVKAVVQISYSGAAMDFAWVVPVHAQPTLSIGSPTLFTSLAQRTAPVFQLQFPDKSCQGGVMFAPAPEETRGAEDGAAGGGGVQVVSQAAVGPYDTAILTADDSSAMTEWLRTNGYDLSDDAAAALVPYVGQGYYFVALKLQQDKGVGDLRPITLDFDGQTPCIPIRLTSIAAQPNMPITAYVLSSHRAVPTNYRHVVLNDARIDWLSGGSNYTQIATAAVREAGGHAFLTELAEPTATVFQGQKIYDGNLDPQSLALQTDPVDFILAVEADNYPQDGLLSLFEKYVPEPQSLVDQGIPEQVFYNQIASFRSDIANDPNRPPFDAQGFANDLEETIVKPLEDAQAMLDSHSYLTRLFTTMSPQDMTLDPEFDFNSGLPDVSNVHTASVTCDLFDTTRMQITLSDGESFVVTRESGPIAAGPASERIEQLAATGAPKVIQDNSKRIDQALAQAAGCACSSGDPAALLALFGLLGALRRRRS